MKAPADRGELRADPVRPLLDVSHLCFKIPASQFVVFWKTVKQSPGCLAPGHHTIVTFLCHCQIVMVVVYN